MATLPTTSRNPACDAVVDLVDGGAGAGEIRIGTTGMATILAVLPMSDPAFGAAAVGVSTANAITDDSSADNTGTAAEYEMRDSNGVNIITGGVGTSGQDINFSSVSFVTGDTISITSLTVTMPAS